MSFQKLVKKSLICIGTSHVIASSLNEFNKNSYEISLGGPDIEEYNIKPNPKNENVEILNVGLVGFIRNYNLSYELINDILKQIKCKLTLIGSIEKEFLNKIEDKDRVVIKGILKGKRLLDEVNEFDVAIVPYLDKKKEEGGVPNKLFIYLALGKPTVVSESVSLKHMNFPPKWIYLVENNKDFSNQIMKAYNENNKNLINKRINYAKENTWDKKINYIIKLLDKHY